MNEVDVHMAIWTTYYISRHIPAPIYTHGQTMSVGTIYNTTINLPIVYIDDGGHIHVIKGGSSGRESTIKNILNSRYLLGVGIIYGRRMFLVGKDMDQLHRIVGKFIDPNHRLLMDYLDITNDSYASVLYGYWRLYDDFGETEMIPRYHNHHTLRLQDIRKYMMDMRPRWVSVTTDPDFMRELRNETLCMILGRIIIDHNGIVCYENDTVRRIASMDDILIQLIHPAKMYICYINVDNLHPGVFVVSHNIELAMGIGRLVLHNPEATVVGYWEEGE